VGPALVSPHSPSPFEHENYVMQHIAVGDCSTPKLQGYAAGKVVVTLYRYVVGDVMMV
jgi:hypothetical protein